MSVGRRAAPVDIDPRAVAPEQVAPSPPPSSPSPRCARARGSDWGGDYGARHDGGRSAQPTSWSWARPRVERLGDRGRGARGSVRARPRVPSSSARRRPRASTLGALAAVAGVAAVVLGNAGVPLRPERDGSADDPAARDARRAIGLLSKPSTDRIRSRGRAADSSSQSEAAGAACSSSAASSRLRREGPARCGSSARPEAPDPDVLFSGNEKVVGWPDRCRRGRASA